MSRIGTAAMLLLLLAGCVRHSRYTVVQQPSTPLGSYGQVQVNDFTNEVATEKESDAQTLEDFGRRIAENVRNNLTGSGLFAGSPDQTLVIDAAITAYRNPSIATRHIVGYGAGEGYVTIKMTLKDGASGEVQAVVDVTAKMVSRDDYIQARYEAMDRITHEVMKFLRASQ